MRQFPTMIPRGQMPVSVPYPWTYMPYQMPSTDEIGMFPRMPGIYTGYPTSYSIGFPPKQDDKDSKRERSRDKSSEKSVSSKKSKTSKRSNVK